ncbi:MAG: RES domain-containing protein, partial [Gemmatimonadaceae bacterium]
RTSRGIDLVAPPFDAFLRAIASPASDTASRPLGTAMRDAGVEAFRYPSARDVEGGVNVGVFVPSVFGRAKPKSLETWHCAASRDRVEVKQADYFKRDRYAFPRDQFLVKGTLPVPAIPQ